MVSLVVHGGRLPIPPADELPGTDRLPPELLSNYIALIQWVPCRMHVCPLDGCTPGCVTFPASARFLPAASARRPTRPVYRRPSQGLLGTESAGPPHLPASHWAAEVGLMALLMVMGRRTQLRAACLQPRTGPAVCWYADLGQCIRIFSPAN